MKPTIERLFEKSKLDVSPLAVVFLLGNGQGAAIPLRGKQARYKARTIG
jgi:hypothetical protein